MSLNQICVHLLWFTYPILIWVVLPVHFYILQGHWSTHLLFIYNVYGNILRGCTLLSLSFIAVAWGTKHQTEWVDSLKIICIYMNFCFILDHTHSIIKLFSIGWSQCVNPPANGVQKSQQRPVTEPGVKSMKLSWSCFDTLTFWVCYSEEEASAAVKHASQNRKRKRSQKTSYQELLISIKLKRSQRVFSRSLSIHQSTVRETRCKWRRFSLCGCSALEWASSQDHSKDTMHNDRWAKTYAE